MDVEAVAKIVVGGGHGAGTTTFVRAASEIAPLDSDVPLGAGAARRGMTTIGFDFGRMTLPPGLALHLFGLPGRLGSRFLWDVVSTGCTGAVVVLDGRRPGDGAAVVDYVRWLAVPFVVAVNRFGGQPVAPPAEVGRAAGTGGKVPVVSCDARNPESARACVAVLAGSLRRLVGAPPGFGARGAGPPAPGSGAG